MTSICDDHPSARLERLLRRIASGDRAAFGQLYDLTAPMLFGMLVAARPSPAEAEEALASTYLALWTGGRRYPSDCSGIGWLLDHLHRVIDGDGARPEQLVTRTS